MHKRFWPVFLALSALAQTPKPPTISDAVKLKFFKAQSEMQTAQNVAREATQTLQQKQVALQSVVSEISNVCGKDFQPQMDKSGDPVCVANPETPKKP